MYQLYKTDSCQCCDNISHYSTVREHVSVSSPLIRRMSRAHWEPMAS